MASDFPIPFQKSNKLIKNTCKKVMFEKKYLQRLKLNDKN